MKALSQKRLAQLVLFSRKAKKLSQQQLADMTGINRAMLSHLESEDYIPLSPSWKLWAKPWTLIPPTHLWKKETASSWKRPRL